MLVVVEGQTFYNFDKRISFYFLNNEDMMTPVQKCYF